MSYQQCGYNYSSQTASSSLNNSQLLIPGSGNIASPATTSCDVTSRVLPSEASPPSGGSTQQTMYSASGLLSYPRVAGLTDTVYSSAYATQGYVPFGTDPSAFYSPLTADNSDAWRSLSGTAGWPYDPNAMASYPYGASYGGLDVRRKNATRESTSTLKAWLYEHIKNPYPTKGEKIMLAIITKMTLTQVSTWFANARRRLKKENKMQWSPRNRSGEDDDHKSDDDGDEDSDSVHGNDARDAHHGNNNNNNSKLLTDGADITANGDDLSTTNFNIHSESSQKDLLVGNHGSIGNHGHHLLENGQDSFVNLSRSNDDPLHLRREDDEDIIVDGGENDPLARLDFSGHDHLLSHSQLKPGDQRQLHPHKLDVLSQHKLDTFEGSPLSQLSTPLGSPHHPLGDALLTQNHHLGVKGHSAHCSTSDMSPASSRSPHDGLTPGADLSKPRIWSIADVATSSTPPPGRRSPNLLMSPAIGSHSLGLGINKSGLTAFTAPVSSQGHMSGFQPWVTGAYSSGTHNQTGLSYGYQLNTHQSLGGASSPEVTMAGAQSGGYSLGGLTGLSNTTGYPTGAKLSPGFLGDKPSLSQFQSGFTPSPDTTHTAFKPVPKRL